jgi:hypothetical protein
MQVRDSVYAALAVQAVRSQARADAALREQEALPEIDVTTLPTAVARHIRVTGQALAACTDARFSCQRAREQADSVIAVRDLTIANQDSVNASILRENTLWKQKATCYWVKFLGIKCPSRTVMFVGGVGLGLLGSKLF